MSFNFIADKNKKVHFIGIGGVSMSGLAEILMQNGYQVSGSDRSASPITEKLSHIGVKIYIGQSAENIQDADLVVYTAAISQDNPELIRAKELNLILLDRAEFLGKIMQGHKYNISVSGTHGKTTATSMISHIILEEDLDPTILVGGNLDIINGNVLVGHSEYFLTEGCEYKESFLKFYPHIGIILNIDEDHLDYYKDINHIKQSFKKFIDTIDEDGYLIANVEDENLRDILDNPKCNVLSFGLTQGTIQAKNISYNLTNCGDFDVYTGDTFLFHINLSVPGEHNILNSLSAICTGLALGLNKESIINGLLSFSGTHRRFEIKGTKNNITVIDEYAHHPTAIKATIKTILKYPHKKIYTLFQPHTYTRTIQLFDDFTTCFNGLDNLILLDIFPAREKDTGIVSSQMLGDKIRETGMNCINIHNFKDAVTYLKENAKPGDLIFTIGAGDLYKIGEDFLSN
ncbi:MAG: UDP-N-acetylmuramate--L-alanine ligase [Clostridium sp.]